MTPSRKRLCIWTLTAAAAVTSAMFVGGCNIIGFAGNALFPPKIDAKYKPEKVPMLVLVENQQNPSMALAESDELAGYIIDDLKAYKVCPLVDRAKLQQLRDQDEKAVEKMTISEIGRAVGAEQVLYVDMRRSNVGTIEGVPLHGRLDVAIKVVDVKTSKTLFPQTASASYALNYETPLMTLEGGSAASPSDLRTTLLGAAGTGIGRCFHEYFPEGQ